MGKKKFNKHTTPTPAKALAPSVKPHLKAGDFPGEVYIEYDAWDMIMAWIAMCPDEIGGVFEVEVKQAGGKPILYIHSPILLPQKVTAGSVELNEQAVHNWLKTKFDLSPRIPTASFGLWHSHVNMDAYWSGQDEEWISNFVNRGWLVSLVANKKRAYDIRVDGLWGGDTEEDSTHVRFNSVMP